MKPYASFGTRTTKQTEPIPGGTTPQVMNNAGGFVYAVDDEKAFMRFLILGSEGGSYYTSEKKLTAENATRSLRFIESRKREAVDMIVQVSDSGRAPKNDPAIFCLALAASCGDADTRAYALDNLQKVCRIPTHLFHFLTYTQNMRGFGRQFKRAIGSWYQDRSVEQLAYQAVKFQSRDGWSNADALRLAHPKTSEPERNGVYRWIVDGQEGLIKYAADKGVGNGVPSIIGAFEQSKLAGADIPKLIREYGLSREMVPTEALNDPKVWEALLEKMPYEAMLRNLGNLSKCGLLKPLSSASKLVQARLLDQEVLQRARIHPIAILLAMKVYGQGHGMKGSGQWEVVPAVRDALDDAFYLAFKYAEPVNKPLVVAVDVSGSMTMGTCGGTPLTPMEGAAAMAMACVRLEREYYVLGFSHELVYINLTNRMTLSEVEQIMRKIPMGGTDCALPMIWAAQNKVHVDGFLTITDNETWYGNIHPSQALTQYRQKMGRPAKNVVMGVLANEFTIADPNDAGSLDVVGFDASVPTIVQEFFRG